MTKPASPQKSKRVSKEKSEESIWANFRRVLRDLDVVAEAARRREIREGKKPKRDDRGLKRTSVQPGGATSSSSRSSGRKASDLTKPSGGDHNRKAKAPKSGKTKGSPKEVTSSTQVTAKDKKPSLSTSKIWRKLKRGPANHDITFLNSKSLEDILETLRYTYAGLRVHKVARLEVGKALVALAKKFTLPAKVIEMMKKVDLLRSSKDNLQSRQKKGKNAGKPVTDPTKASLSVTDRSTRLRAQRGLRVSTFPHVGTIADLVVNFRISTKPDIKVEDLLLVHGSCFQEEWKTSRAVSNSKSYSFPSWTISSEGKPIRVVRDYKLAAKGVTGYALKGWPVYTLSDPDVTHSARRARLNSQDRKRDLEALPAVKVSRKQRKQTSKKPRKSSQKKKSDVEEKPAKASLHSEKSALEDSAKELVSTMTSFYINQKSIYPLSTAEDEDVFKSKLYAFVCTEAEASELYDGLSNALRLPLGVFGPNGLSSFISFTKDLGSHASV